MTSTANNFFVLNQSTGMQSITYSGAAAGQYKDDIIGIYNTDALSASVDLGTVSGMSLTLGGVLLNTFTASASKYTTVNVGIVNVSIASTFSIDPTTVFGSCLMLNDVTTSSTASSIRGTYTNSTITIDTCDLRKGFTFASGSLSGSRILVTDTVSSDTFVMSGFATKDESAVDIENSIFNVDGSGDAMYFTTSIFYTGCRFGLDNVQLNGTNALNMVG